MPKLSLKALRVNKELTQKQFADLLGVSEKTVWSWENHKSYPNAKQLEVICEVCEVHYDNLKFE